MALQKILILFINVWEWTATWQDEKKEQRIVRGGGFNDEVALRRARWQFKKARTIHCYRYGRAEDTTSSLYLTTGYGRRSD